MSNIYANANLKLDNFNDPNCFSGEDETALSEIYDDKYNISIWSRRLDESIINSAKNIINKQPNLELKLFVRPDNVEDKIKTSFTNNEELPLISRDIKNLVDMYCYLFELNEIGLSLRVLDKAMCPRFHVDHVPCRLITTYTGVTTQWLPHTSVDRSKLGKGNNGKKDEESGLFGQSTDIKQLCVGDVALLKGESWYGNSGAGLVHRSPHVEDTNSKRLLLTLDFLN